MLHAAPQLVTAFIGQQQLASGRLAEVALGRHEGIPKRRRGIHRHF